MTGFMTFIRVIAVLILLSIISIFGTQIHDRLKVGENNAREYSSWYKSADNYVINLTKETK